MSKMKIEIIENKGTVLGNGGKKITGIVDFEEKEAKRLIKLGLAKKVDGQVSPAETIDKPKEEPVKVEEKKAETKTEEIKGITEAKAEEKASGN